MRDLLVILFTFGGSFQALFRPWVGVLALAVLAYLNPHRYAWGFSRAFPVYFIVFVATMAGFFLNRDERQPFPWTRETITFVLLLGWFTLTTFIAPDVPNAASDQWVKVMKIYVGIFPTLWLINTEDRFKWLLITIAFSFGLIGIKGGIFALGTGLSYRVWGPDNTFYGGNNEIALALNMMLPIFLLLAKWAKNVNLRVLYYSTFVLCVCSVIASRSRGAFLTLCVVLLSIILSSRRKWVAVPVLAIGLLIAIPRLPDVWMDRMDTISEYEQDGSAMGRIEAWGYAYQRALEDPILGGGFETFLLHVRDVHSAYFEILGEHGFVALALWLSLLLGALISLQRLRKRVRSLDNGDWWRDCARAIQISIVGYAVGGAFLGAAYWDIFYHLVALGVLMKVLIRRREEALSPAPAEASAEPTGYGIGVPVGGYGATAAPAAGRRP